GVMHLLDVQEEGEREHPAGEACDQLRPHEAPNAARLQQVDIALHKSTSLAPADAVSRRRRGRIRMSVAAGRITAQAVQNSAKLCTSVDDTPTRYGDMFSGIPRYIVVERSIGTKGK